MPTVECPQCKRKIHVRDVDLRTGFWIGVGIALGSLLVALVLVFIILLTDRIGLTGLLSGRPKTEARIPME